MDPLFRIEKLSVDMDETTTAVDFFQSIVRLLAGIKPGKIRRLTVFVQAEDVEPEAKSE